MIKEKFKLLTIIGLMGALLAVFLPGTAYAFDLFDEFQSDYLVNNTLKMVFGGDGKTLTESSLLTAANVIFVAAAMIVAGLLAMYTLLAGTASTANDGELLGKKWSSMWVPVKTSLGTALILPAFNGWAGVQVIVYWIALQGIWLADATWSAFVVGGNMANTAVYQNRSVINQIQPLFDEMIRMNAMALQADKEFQKTKSETNGNMGLLYRMYNGTQTPPKYGFTKGTEDTSLVINYGDQSNTYAGASTIFGQLKYNMTTREMASNSSMQYSNSLINIKNIEQDLAVVHSAQALELNDKALALAKKIVNGEVGSNGIREEYYSALVSYNDALNNAAKPIFAKATNYDVKMGMMKDGWITAWAWFVPITLAQSTMQAGMDNIPVVEKPMLSYAQRAILEKTPGLKTVVEQVNSIIDDARKTANTKIQNNYGAVTKSSVADDNTWGMALNAIMNGNSKHYQSSLSPLLDISGSGSSFLAPIVKLMGVGNVLIDIVNAAMIALTTGSIIAAIPFAGNAVVAAYTILAPMLTMLLGSLLMPAMVLKFVIPMMPLIVGIGIIISWLMSLCKALFGSVIWAITFLSPDQDGFVGKQGQGYMLLLQLLLKPSLSIMGFICSLALMVPVSTMVGYLFEIAMPVSQSGFSGLLQLIAMSIIYMIINFNVFKELLTISHTLPDEIFVWIGGHANNEMGKYSSGMESASRQSAGAMLGTAAMGAKTASQGVGKIGSQLGERNIAKRHKANDRKKAAADAKEVEITKK
ncbi:DotA/TraY family protein [Salmonella enterica subsp. enterica serovar Anatum]|nr:DotA/TraY family protein [Salmonella enterica subsp. enterica serovar Anatum]